MTATREAGSKMCHEMALFMVLIAIEMASGLASAGEMALANVTRFAPGDLFSLVGTDCGLTRCMELSHGTALAALGTDSGCVCQCRRETPAFREDQRICVNHIDECLMASFGRGATKPQIPFVFLPLKGQIIYPSKEIIFTDVADAICAVTSAQYLSASGWVTLRDLVDNDVPFSLYRDEGSTFLQWRGSASLHARLEGRLVAAHVLCSAPEQTRLAASCAAFRIAGATHNALLDVKSIPFHAGEIVSTEPTASSHGLSVLESLAIGVCVLMLIFIYAAGIIFYLHYKQRQKRKEKDPEMNLSNTISTDNGSTLDSRIDMDNVQMKTNPLLSMSSLNNDYLHDAGLSDVSERTEDTMDSSPNNIHKFQKPNSNVVAAMVHTRRKKPVRPNTRATSTPERINERLQRRSASPDTLERAPHSDLSIIDCSVEQNNVARQPVQSSNGEPALRKKLYFNPVFFETEHLKNPPPAAIEFLIKIREIMSIAKEKMTSKRFIPILSDIPEEELYHTIDLGWDIPCARRGRRFSAISLKHENSRRAVHCGGCPGCDSSVNSQKNAALIRSNSCKTCVSDDYKQRIVRKWLDEVPTPSPVIKPVKSVAKVSGTPRITEPKNNDENSHVEPIRNDDSKHPIEILRNAINDVFDRDNTTKNNEIKIDEISGDVNVEITSVDKQSPLNHRSRRIRKKLPPPPPPPVDPPESPKEEDAEPIPPEVKMKMEAVIRELNKCRRVEPKELEDVKMETIVPIAPKIIIPVLAADSQYYSDDNMLPDRKKEFYIHRDNAIDFDSLERNVMRRRRFSLACEPELTSNEEYQCRPSIQVARERLSSSWRDIKKAVEEQQIKPQPFKLHLENKSEIFINAAEPYYDNMCIPGSLTIKVSGSPVEDRKNENEEFDPDTLDRKPKPKKRVEKILLKSGGSFKCKAPENENDESKTPPEAAFTRKIGSLRQIYEAKTKVQGDDMEFYGRRGSIPFMSQEITGYSRTLKTPDLICQVDAQKDLKPPIPPKQRRGSDMSPKCSNTRDSPPDRRRMSEERDRFSSSLRLDNLNARRSGRRSARARSRRTDFRKVHRTEDSGYMSTDSNESKRRAKYLLQLRPKTILLETIPNAKILMKTPLQIESDTDDLESLCDGRSESGAESVETDSVFFGNFDDTKELFAELGLGTFELQGKGLSQEQIDSGFMGETNIILSGDSDSEHRSVISIIAGRDGRASAASITKIEDPPYVHSVEC
ncbi:uncharacterized protein LOC135079935 [Ostrinia nubilalis]|uniref:uncharacterized protein LOC135079935 n=1 Tax=Ostrinia nubilalis TaxID=29057 RepID=UPI0030822E49